MKLPHTVVIGSDTFKPGTKLAAWPQMVAYFTEVLNDQRDEGETALTSDKIIAALSPLDLSGMDNADADLAILETLRSVEADMDDAPEITPVQLTMRRNDASRYAALLNGEFSQHVVEVLDAGDTIKKGPFVEIGRAHV